jgi:hypothetical protein
MPVNTGDRSQVGRAPHQSCICTSGPDLEAWMDGGRLLLDLVYGCGTIRDHKNACSNVIALTEVVASAKVGPC